MKRAKPHRNVVALGMAILFTDLSGDMRQSGDGRYVAGAVMRQQESVPAPRGRTRGAAWKGTGASLLLHLFVGTGMIVALSGPPKPPPQVIDLTLLPPAGIVRRPVPPAFAAAVKPPSAPGTTVLPEQPVHPASPAAANRPEGIPPANLSDPVASSRASTAGIAGSLPPAQVYPASPGVAAGSRESVAPNARAATVRGGGDATKGNPSEKTGEGAPAAGLVWIRDSIQHAIAYPATARRMGWEGKVVVAFQLLRDGSVRDVRVVQGSGHAALDRGAVDAVRNASPFPRSPVEAEVITPVVYRLTTR